MEPDDGSHPESARQEADATVQNDTTETAEGELEDDSMPRFPLEGPILPSIGDFGEGFSLDQFSSDESHNNMLGFNVGDHNDELVESDSVPAGEHQERHLFKTIQQGHIMVRIYFDGNNATPNTRETTDTIQLQAGENLGNAVNEDVEKLNVAGVPNANLESEEYLYELISTILDRNHRHDWLPDVLQGCFESTHDTVQNLRRARVELMKQFKYELCRVKNYMQGISGSMQPMAKQQLTGIPIAPKPKRKWYEEEEPVAVACCAKTSFSNSIGGLLFEIVGWWCHKKLVSWMK